MHFLHVHRIIRERACLAFPGTCCDIARTCVASVPSVSHRNAIVTPNSGTKVSEKSQYYYKQIITRLCIGYLRNIKKFVIRFHINNFNFIPIIHKS